MPLTFRHYRPSSSSEYPVMINRVDVNNQPVTGEYYLFPVEAYRHKETCEINSVKVEIIDNKPLYIPLGKSSPTYKIQFKTRTISEFNMWYTVLGNDVLEVLISDYEEFPVTSFWNVETISHNELPGSAFTKSDTLVGKQLIWFDYELELSRSFTSAAGVDRPILPEEL